MHKKHNVSFEAKMVSLWNSWIYLICHSISCCLRYEWNLKKVNFHQKCFSILTPWSDRIKNKNLTTGVALQKAIPATRMKMATATILDLIFKLMKNAFKTLLFIQFTMLTNLCDDEQSLFCKKVAITKKLKYREANVSFSIPTPTLVAHELSSQSTA